MVMMVLDCICYIGEVTDKRYQGKQHIPSDLFASIRHIVVALNLASGTRSPWVMKTLRTSLLKPKVKSL